MKCCWRYQNRHTYRSVEHNGTHIAGANIHEYARSKSDALECCAVSTHCHLVVATTLIIVPGTRFHMSLGKHFVVKNVDWFHKQPTPYYVVNIPLHTLLWA